MEFDHAVSEPLYTGGDAPPPHLYIHLFSSRVCACMNSRDLAAAGFCFRREIPTCIWILISFGRGPVNSSAKNFRKRGDKGAKRMRIPGIPRHVT